MDISTSCITTASGTPRARAHLAYGVASSLESQRHQFEYLSDQRCCQAGLQGVDVSWSGWKRRGGEQVSVIPEGRRATVRVLVLLLVVLTGCSAQPHVPRVSSSPSE